MKLRSRREGEYMSLEAIERVSQAEVKNQERKAAAEAEAKLIVAQAEQDAKERYASYAALNEKKD